MLLHVRNKEVVSFKIIFKSIQKLKFKMQQKIIMKV